MRSAWRAIVAIAVLVALAGGVRGAASAQDRSATRAEVAALAERAVDDDAALAGLRAITTVDGRPVDLAAATESLGNDRAARLRALAGAFDGADAPAATSAEARELAERVLADRKYHDRQAPKPFKGLLEWLADRLRPIGRPFADLFDAASSIPGGSILLLGALGALFGWSTWWLVERRSGALVGIRSPWSLVDPGQDPDDLDRAAEAAEAAGDHALAVRRRYEAGLLRLARADRIVLRSDTTASEVAAGLGDPQVRNLTDTFEAVVYGGRLATPADAAEAREGWRSVLRERVRA